ncbi:MAG: lipopolysaccharide heptosyltransferase II [bacterium]
MPSIDRRLLIADLAFLGDTLMTTPVITNLRRNHPHAILDFLVSDESAVVVRHNQDLNEVIEVDKATYRKNGWKDLAALAERLKIKHYDTVFLVHRSARTALLALMAGIPSRVGLATQGRRLLLTHPVALDETRHRTDNALALLTAVGEPISTRTLAFTPAPGAAFRAEGLLFHHGWSGSVPLIALAPGGSWVTKRWAPERFAAVATLLDQAGYRVAVVGGPGDMALAETVQQRTTARLMNLAGATTFDELFEVFRRCAGVIANDSGPMHLAAAAGVPLVGLFGPTSPARCGPVSHAATTLAGDVPCLGCYFKQCEHHSCMAYLAPRQVLQSLEGLFREAGILEPLAVEPT